MIKSIFRQKIILLFLVFLDKDLFFLKKKKDYFETKTDLLKLILKLFFILFIGIKYNYYI